MTSNATCCILTALLSAMLGGCAKREPARSDDKNGALAGRIDQLVETFLTSDDDAKEKSSLADAKAIFEREGVPSVARVGDAAAYGFVLVNMLGQPPEFRTEFMVKLRAAAARHELPADAVTFAEARFRQGQTDDRFRTRVPSDPALRDDILRLLKADQAVRQKEGFDTKKMEKTDRETAMPLKVMFERYGVPTYDMVGVDAAKGFLLMVQHQAPELRQAVLPMLKSNVDAGQGDAGIYAMVYDRTQRDGGKKQLYGEQLECLPGRPLSEAPIEDEATVNMRRAQLGLLRIELYARLVRLHSPDMCGSGPR
jgi:hypothetical protein